MKRLMAVSAVLLLTASAGANATQGDPELGKSKVEEVCKNCHGMDGKGIAPTFPNLAGQVPGYISTQLAMFKAGVRKDEPPLMMPQALSLSEEEMHNLDAYYAALKPVGGAITPEQEEAAKAGGKIYRGGYKPYQISACMSCHGPSGHGIPPKFPRIAGQSPVYLEKQLQDFKNGVRKHEMMSPIAFALSEEQIKDLALYMSGLY